MLYRPALHGNWNALSIARRALKDKFPTPTVPLTVVLQNRQVFLPDPVFHSHKIIYSSATLDKYAIKFNYSEIMGISLYEYKMKIYDINLLAS